MPKIAYEDITVVVQGPVGGKPEDDFSKQKTRQCLLSIRKVLPGAKIVLSTYKGSPVGGLDYDEICWVEPQKAEYVSFPQNLITKIPSGMNSCFFQYGNSRRTIVASHINSMILSTQKGLAQVSTPYALKIRSDMCLENDNFLHYFDRYPQYQGKYKLFKKRILSGSVFAMFQYYHSFFAKNKNSIQRLPFHMSDWIHFGYTEDVQLLYSIPLQPQEHFHYFFNHPKKNYLRNTLHSARYNIEIYILYSLFVKKFGDIGFNDRSYHNERIMAISNLFMVNNFVFIDDMDFRFRLEKYPREFSFHYKMLYGFITHEYWHQMYRHLVDKKSKVMQSHFKLIRSFFLTYAASVKANLQFSLQLFKKGEIGKSFKIFLLFFTRKSLVHFLNLGVTLLVLQQKKRDFREILKCSEESHES